MITTTDATPQAAADLAGRSFRRILVCQLRQIGDALLATPAVAMLKRAWPEAEIHFLTEKKCAPVLENNPFLAKVWTIDKKELSTLGREVAFYWRVARQEFDLVVDFQQLPRIRWVVAFSRADVRLTYTPPWYNRWLYTHWTDMEGGYAAMSKASILRLLGLPWTGEKPRLYLRDEERVWANRWLAERGAQPDDVLVTVDPSHRRETRKWPAAHFGRLMALALARRPELKFILPWGPGEQEEAKTVMAASDAPERCILPERLLTLREMAAIIAKARMHIGNCSAPRHFAAALDTPSLTVLGATGGAWTCPDAAHDHINLGLPCQPCNKNSCPDVKCLSDLAPERVLPEFLRKLDQKGL